MSFPRPPKFVRLGTRLVEILRPRRAHEILVAAGESAVTDKHMGWVAFDYRAAPGVQQVSVLHELMHQAWDSTNLVALDFSKLDQDDVEETVIRALDEFVLSLIQQNPELVIWLSLRPELPA